MLAGKVAIITGGGSGIGRAACSALARLDAHIVCADLNKASADSTIKQFQGGNHMSVELDVSDQAAAEACFTKVIHHFGTPPHVLVNSAGMLRDAFFLNMTLEQFKSVVDVHLTGTFIMTQLACQKMVDAQIKGSIINLSSIVGQTGNIAQANYSASKAGIRTLTMTVAQEMGRYGIRCNCVLPGLIESPMTDGMKQKIKDLFISKIPLARIGKAEEVAEVISFLASDKSSFVNGAAIPVTGGAPC